MSALIFAIRTESKFVRLMRFVNVINMEIIGIEIFCGLFCVNNKRHLEISMLRICVKFVRILKYMNSIVALHYAALGSLKYFLITILDLFWVFVVHFIIMLLTVFYF